MKPLLLTLFLIIVHHSLHAQSSNDNVIGRYGDQHYVVKKEGYYIAEYFGSKKDTVVVRDTLLPVNSSTETFRGNIFKLSQNHGYASLDWDNGKNGAILETPTADDLKRRTQLHNYFYYLPYKSNMTQYAGSPKDSDKKRGGIYIQIRELSIEEFKRYFDAFVQKHKIKQDFVR